MRLIAIVLILQVGAWGADYFVAPDGNDEAAGTITAPWSLSKITRTTRSGTPMSVLAAGDTVWMRGGNYPITQMHYFENPGTSEARVTVRAYPGELPIIRSQSPGWSGAALSVSASYVTIQGIAYTHDGQVVENTNTEPDGRVPSGIQVLQELLGAPVGVEIVNVQSWRSRAFVSATSADQGTTYYGNIVFGQNAADIDRNHGGACYIQNAVANGWETLKHNVFLNNPGHYNCRGYATSGTVQGVRLLGNITFGGNNYFSRFDAGDQGPYDFQDNTWVLDSDNLLIEKLGTIDFLNNVVTTMTPLQVSLRIRSFDTATITGNRLHGYSAAGNFGAPNDGYTATVNDNDYSTEAPGGTNANARACVSGVGYTGRPHSAVDYPTFWPNLADPTHPEPDSTCTDGMPTTNIVRVYVNERETGRAHVAVMNYESAASASVDLSGAFVTGDRYEVIDLWNPLAGTVASGIYVGSAVSLPLTGTATYDPLNQTPACYQIDRALCLTSGEYVVADTVEELPAGAFVGQRALLPTYALYRWTGSAWSANGTMSTVAWPTFQRIAGAHAFLVRRLYDGRSETTLAWRGAVTDVLEAGYLKPDASITWGELPVTQIACADGRCRAKVPQSLGNAYWRINGGVALKAAARGRETVPVVPGPLDSPWSADFSEDFGPGGAN